MKTFLSPASASACVMTGCASAVAEKDTTSSDGRSSLPLSHFMKTPRLDCGEEWLARPPGAVVSFEDEVHEQAFRIETRLELSDDIPHDLPADTSSRPSGAIHVPLSRRLDTDGFSKPSAMETVGRRPRLRRLCK
jgi:hypothetical protein